MTNLLPADSSIPVGECDCAIQCFGASSCICMFIYESEEGDDGQCICDCSFSASSAPADLPLNALVNISARDTELGGVGEFINRMTRAELGIPASKVRIPVTTYLKRVRLSAALRDLGLVVLQDS
jgi:hypothetical protein